VQRCPSTMATVANGCGPVVSPRTGRRLGSPPHEQQPTTLHHRAEAGALVWLSDSILVSLPLCFKLEHFIIYVFLCNSRIHVITLCSGHTCVVLCVNASVLVPRMDPG
jgi:hypothetical protein